MHENTQDPVAQTPAPAESPAIQPERPKQRIQVIDTLRGVALLGILIINMISFANPDIIYLNPTAYGSYEGVEKWIWRLSHVFADQKFMTLFSPLYGAGILLLTGRIEARGQSATSLFYRRSLWLLGFGLIHMIFLWTGDILTLYALVGMVVYLLRNRAPSTLLWLGLVVVGVHMMLSLGSGWLLRQAPPEYQMEVIRAEFVPSMDDLKADIAAYRGTWLDQQRQRWSELPDLVFLIFSWGIWRAGGLMLIGMAAWKWGVFTAERSERFYGRLILAGAVGLVVVSLGLWDKERQGWDIFHALLGPGSVYNYWGSLLVSGGYVGVVMLVERKAWLPGLRARLSAVGRMAFTNYILHTVVCTAIFYGYGLGLYAQTSRLEQTGIIALIWAFQLLVSPWWLERFRYGPLEWLWRCLTYGRRLPIRR